MNDPHRATAILAITLLAASSLLACASKDPAASSTAAGAGRAAAGGSGGSAASGRGASGSPEPTASGNGVCGSGTHQLFPVAAPWNTKISAGRDGESDAIVRALDQNHTDARRFQIDFSINVLRADGSPRKAFTPNDDFYETECDPAPVPVPASGALEGEQGYECTSDGDCHLIVVEESSCRLYEMWRANIAGGVFHGGCLAIWQLDQVPPETGRGDQCTSADAAGLPIAPLLFTADEVADGVIPHALRFILPNRFIRNATYVRPGSHATRAASGGADSPPYGARFRLKPGTDISKLSASAQVVARALIDYGMYLADGGNLTFTAQSDLTTTHRWDELDLQPRALQSLKWSDFEMVEGGSRITWNGNCERTPITQ